MRIFCQKIHEFVPLDSKSMFHHYLLYQNTYLRGPLHTLSMFPARHGDVHSSPSGGMDCPQHPAANARCSLSWNLMESIVISPYPIGSMYGIYANIGDILMGSMLPYIAAPWIRHGYLYPSKWTSINSSIRSIFIPKYQISNKWVLVIPWVSPPGVTRAVCLQPILLYRSRAKYGHRAPGVREKWI